MNRPSWKSLVFGVVVVAALFAVVDQANAGWWHGGCCGVYGPFPSYTAWDSCCGGGDWYYGYPPWSVGGIVGLAAGMAVMAAMAAAIRPTRCCSTYSLWRYVVGCCGDTVYGIGTLSVPGTVTAPGQPTPPPRSP